MSEFIIVNGVRTTQHINSLNTWFPRSHSINVHDIVAITSEVTKYFITQEKTDDLPELQEYKTVCCVHPNYTEIHGPNRDPYTILVEGSIAEWVEKINKAIADAHAVNAVASHKAIQNLEAQPYYLVDQGEWDADTTYKPLDYITDRGVVYLCAKENKSSSKGVLSNKDFWCKIVLPEKD